jgi:hypothetical protein
MEIAGNRPSAQRWVLIALIALLGLAITAAASNAGASGHGQAVAAKKHCKKHKRSAGAAKKKKKCKRKKTDFVTPPTIAPPASTPSTPSTPKATLRASLSFDDNPSDLDLYVWDAAGNLAAFDGNDIPDSDTTSNSASPEQFFDHRSPSTRDFTYGVCVYSDGDGDAGTSTDVDYTLNAPGDSPPFTDSDTLAGGSGDWVLYVGTYDPDPLNSGDWCENVDDNLL